MGIWITFLATLKIVFRSFFYLMALFLGYCNGSLGKAKYPLPLPVSERDGLEGIHKPHTFRSSHSYNTVQLHCNLMLQIIRHLAALKNIVMLAKLDNTRVFSTAWFFMKNTSPKSSPLRLLLLIHKKREFCESHESFSSFLVLWKILSKNWESSKKFWCFSWKNTVRCLVGDLWNKTRLL